MAKTNHRTFYEKTLAENLREEVKSAYTEYTKDSTNLSGTIFDDTSYKLSAHYAKLIELLEIHCSSYKRGHTDILSNSTLHKFFTAQPILKKNQTGFNFEQRTIDILTCFASTYQTSQTNTIPVPQINYNQNEVEILEVAKALQDHYVQNEIDIGVTKANAAYETYGSHPQILKHTFRFNMRKKEWERIRSIVERVLEENPSDVVKTQCHLTLFECELREANSVYKSDRRKRSEKILYGKKFLNEVPNSQHEYEQYLYWYGRWYLELWHSTNGDDSSHLRQALLCFENSIEKKYTWWVHCYKCIILKLLGNSTFTEEAINFTTYISDKTKQEVKRPAGRIYHITSFILNDDMPGLKTFLAKDNAVLSPTDFEFTIFHHIELIYHNESAKQADFKKVLNNWIAELPLK